MRDFGTLGERGALEHDSLLPPRSKGSDQEGGDKAFMNFMNSLLPPWSKGFDQGVGDKALMNHLQQFFKIKTTH